MGRFYNFKTLILLIIVLIVGLAAFGMKWFAGSKLVASEQPASEGAGNRLAISADQEKQASIRTQVLSAATDTIAADLVLQGQAIWSPASQLLVTSPISGVVQQILVQPLAEVEKSAKIAVIYSPDIIQIQNEVLQLRAQQQLDSQQLAREQSLFAEGIIAEKRVQEARNRVQQNNINLQAKQRLLQFMGQGSGRSLDPTIQVKSPTRGVIESLDVSLGQFVESGAVIAKVVKRDMPLLLNLQMPSKQQGVQVGDLVKVDGCEITGNVAKISPSLMGNTQTKEVLVQMQASHACLSVNQYVQANIQTASKADSPVWSVPSTAIMLKDNKNYIFVKAKTGFEAQEVEVVVSNTQTTHIRGAGLAAGQVIAVTGVDRLKAVLAGFGAEQADAVHNTPAK